jgi:hypothetical protein
MFRHLALGRTTDQVEGGDLKDLLELIAEKTDGFDVALNILFMRLYSDRSEQRQPDSELLNAGQSLLRRIKFKKGNQREEHELAAVVRACLTGPESAPVAAEVANHLKRAIMAYETYSFDNDDLLRALLAVQPTAALDALFGGDDQEQRAGLEVFDHRYEHRSNPADEISCEELIGWCNQDREKRFALAASFVTFAHSADEGGPQVWSDQAKALLTYASDPGTVLVVFIERFRPLSWSGSRAALMEANVGLLDSLDEDLAALLMPIIADARIQLAQQIEREREWETVRDRGSDERFE